jgi:hypothetical protein
MRSIFTVISRIVFHNFHAMHCKQFSIQVFPKKDLGQALFPIINYNLPEIENPLYGSRLELQRWPLEFITFLYIWDLEL